MTEIIHKIACWFGFHSWWTCDYIYGDYLCKYCDSQKDKPMTLEKFDNYRFSIKTKVKHSGEWSLLEWVDFEDRTIKTLEGQIIKCLDIQALEE